MEKHVRQSTADVSDGSRAYGLSVWKDENGILGYEIIGIHSGYVKGELLDMRTVERPAERPATLEEAKSAAESSLRSYLKKPDLKIVWKDLV